jgi:hypothetical protein
MMGPLYKFRDDDHLNRMIESVRSFGISVVEDPRVDSSGAYCFRKGIGKVHGAIGTDEWDSMIYLGFGHPMNPFLWYFDGALQKQIETVFLAEGSERINTSGSSSE